MSEWKIVKLNEVLKHKKASIKIDEDTEYKLCRVQVHRRGVVLRAKQFGHQIKTKKQQVCQTGDLIVAEMDAKFGGYGFIPSELNGAIVSSHYYLYELDKNKISQDYFQTLISTDYIQNQIEAKGSTNYSSIRAKEFLEYEIPLPSLELQNEISKRFLTYSDFKTKLNDENSIQQTYLTKLRQAILQEAIEGKLTAEWRIKNPVCLGDPNTDAAALLTTIKTEKQKLITEGKIKKEKPLSPIKPNEIPFNLPQGWVWVRLGELFEIQRGSSPRPKSDSRYFSKNKTANHWIKISDISSYSINGYLTNTNEFLTNEGINFSRYVTQNDIIVAASGSVGKVCLLKIDGYIYDGFMAIKNITNEIIRLYLFLIFKTFENALLKKAIGSIWKNITTDLLNEMLIPLPPLAEQQAIVERVDRLHNHINTLEQQVTERKHHAEQLMQAVLKEAFSA